MILSEGALGEFALGELQALQQAGGSPIQILGSYPIGVVNPNNGTAEVSVSATPPVGCDCIVIFYGGFSDNQASGIDIDGTVHSTPDVEDAFGGNQVSSIFVVTPNDAAWPGTGSSVTFTSVSNAPFADQRRMGVAFFSGVDQTTPVGNTNSQAGSLSSVSLPLTTDSNGYCVGAVSCFAGDPAAVSTGETEVFANRTGSGNLSVLFWADPSDGSSTTVSNTLTASSSTAATALALNPSTSGGGGGTPGGGSGSGTISGTATASASSSKDLVGSGTTTGSSSTSGDATKESEGSGSISGDSTATASGTVFGSVPGSGTINGSATSIAQADVIKVGSGSSSGSSTSTANGNPGTFGSGSSSGSSTSTGIATKTYNANATASGSSTASADGDLINLIVYQGSGQSDGDANVVASGNIVSSGSGTSEGVATASADSPLPVSSLVLAGEFKISEAHWFSLD